LLNIDHHQETHRKLVKKVKNSHELVDNLDERIRNVTRDIGRLKHSLLEVQQAYMAKNAPLQLCTWRQERRSRRPPRELVRDCLEEALDAEKDTLISAQKRLKENGHRTEKLAKSLVSTLEELQKDRLVKAQACEIDEKCTRMLHKMWPHVQRGRQPPEKDPTGDYALRHHKSEEKRKDDVSLRLDNSRAQEASAAELWAANEALIQETTVECGKAVKEVEHCMKLVIESTQTLRKGLQEHISQTNQEIDHLTQTIALTSMEMRGHDEPLELATERTKKRSMRPTRENIGDPVTTALVEQHGMLKTNLEWLCKRSEAETSALQELHNVKAELEMDLGDKTQAFHIDLDCQRRQTCHFVKLGGPKRDMTSTH
jgi:hypothetical protein